MVYVHRSGIPDECYIRLHSTHTLAMRLFSLQYLHSLSLSLITHSIGCEGLRSPRAALSPSHHSEPRGYRVIIIPVLRIVHLWL